MPNTNIKKWQTIVGQINTETIVIMSRESGWTLYWFSNKNTIINWGKN
jgi:hypothetical protein